MLEAGALPNLAALIARGHRGVSRSCIPSHSWAAWPTFLTGADPAGHGVFDILEYKPGASRRLPVSSHSILAPTWPQRMTEAGRTTLLVNVPLTYPAPEITGVCIAGGVIPGNSPFSHPPEVGPRARLADQRRLLDDVSRPARSSSSTTWSGSPGAAPRRCES